MRDSADTPPPLYYSPVSSDRGRASPAESTPVSTPVDPVAQAFGFPPLASKRREKDLYFSWHRRPEDSRPNSARLEEDLLFPDSPDCSFPLFPDSPPTAYPTAMARPPSPIDIAHGQRYNSQSPRNQTSNLTSALQEAGVGGPQTSAINIEQRDASDARLGAGRNGSISGQGSYYSNGAKPISMKDRPRRESNTSSYLNGMSWGGVSVGSWVRDDVIMASTSPFAFHQSPSFHSSSYLPKMEASFMRDFTCCGLTLDSLHALLTHYEEAHAQPVPQAMSRQQLSQGGMAPQPGGPVPQQGFAPRSNSMQSYQSSRNGSDAFTRTQLTTVQDMDALEDMEMDDPLTPSAMHQPHHFDQQFDQCVPRVAPINVNIANTMQSHQGLRTSTPTTPSAAQQGFQLPHNPTVSSVNTPVFQQRTSPGSSAPGTPSELDDFNGYGMPMYGTNMMPGAGGDYGFSGMEYGTNDVSNMTINDPAKVLFSRQGGLNQQQLQYAVRNGQYASNPEVAKRIIAGRSIGFPEPESKPFRCPVIGCEKAYKNQNGLKYHKQHGHQRQQLKRNDDGTYSIVDPETSIPYPGTLGMEKEKPYSCEICGKRYKNLNGLKYHKQHSDPCNPELIKQAQLNLAAAAAGAPPVNMLQGNNVNVAGAGLAGMGAEAGMY